ncbi:MAG TPA: sugar phosphate isomerase/epimerase family protein [Rectinemataceae bacterium]|nr:sugar phosphate isomerase/epimerase family protein [Rectinemataceae bacterium]
MKYGMYYAYWEKRWGADYLPYVARVARLGFDILEISCASLSEMPRAMIEKLCKASEASGVTLTAGYGPQASENIASGDPAIVKNGIAFWSRTFPVLRSLGIKQVGGGLYSCWPVDYSRPVDKAADLERSVAGVKKLAALADDCGITLGMEVLNRHEGYLLNTAAEGVAFVKAVDKPNVKVMLDTYHMNLEEDSFEEAIRTAGEYLGHFHIGECNRRLPFRGGRIPWASIGETLREIGYEGTVVMEPFVLTGGQVGKDIRVWRDLSDGAGAEKLDDDAAASLSFVKDMFEDGK